MEGEVIDHRLLEPIELLHSMVLDLPPYVTIDEELGEIEHDPADILLSSAAGGAFTIYAHNPLTGRTHALETGHVFGAWADFMMFPSVSVALFFEQYEPFGDTMHRLPVSSVVARCCHWRSSHSVHDEEALMEEFLRVWLGEPLPALFPFPIYMLAVKADGMEQAAREVRREHAAFGKGTVAERRRRPGPTPPPPVERLALTSMEASHVLGIPDQTLRRWRLQDKGPPWIKAGDGRSGKVLYRRAAVENWMKEQEGGS